jgi:hypothetical protein
VAERKKRTRKPFKGVGDDARTAGATEPQPRRRRTLPPGTRVPPLWQMGGSRPHTEEDETTPEEES